MSTSYTVGSFASDYSGAPLPHPDHPQGSGIDLPAARMHLSELSAEVPGSSMEVSNSGVLVYAFPRDVLEQAARITGRSERLLLSKAQALAQARTRARARERARAWARAYLYRRMHLEIAERPLAISLASNHHRLPLEVAAGGMDLLQVDEADAEFYLKGE